MARARIGKLFHLTPLVDSLRRRRVLLQRRVLAAVHDAQLLGRTGTGTRRSTSSARRRSSRCTAFRRSGPADATSWYRYAERFGPRVHNMAFYVDDLDELAERLEAAGVRITDAGSRHDRLLPPEGHAGHARVPSRPRRSLGRARPPLPRRVARVPPTRTGAGTTRSACNACRTSPSSSTTSWRPRSSTWRCSTRMPLPDQAATIDGGTARHVLVGEDTILELLAPGDTDTVAAPRPRPRRPVGHRGDVHRARRGRAGRSGSSSSTAPVSPRSPTHELRLRRRPRRGVASTASPTGSSRATHACDRGGDGRRSVVDPVAGPSRRHARATSSSAMP